MKYVEELGHAHDNKSNMTSTINHQYWDIYSRLTALRKAPVSAQAGDEIGRLAIEAGLSAKDRLIIRILMMFPWFNTTMVEETFFLTLREQFSYAVLSPEMLNIISSYSPLVELGAGNGYNAWLLQQMGAEVVAIDAYPVEEGKNWFFNTRFGLPSRAGRSFTEVQKGNCKTIQAFLAHTLLLCWPPRNSMAMMSLLHYAGPRVILIGVKKCCANSAFYQELSKHWSIESAVKTGSWDSCHTELLEIYSRRPNRSDGQP